MSVRLDLRVAFVRGRLTTVSASLVSTKQIVWMISTTSNVNVSLASLGDSVERRSTSAWTSNAATVVLAWTVKVHIPVAARLDSEERNVRRMSTTVSTMLALEEAHARMESTNTHAPASRASRASDAIQ